MTNTSCPPRLAGAGRYFAHYLVAQFQALTADPRVSGRGHGRDLLAALPAEAALLRPGLITNLLDRGDGRAGHPARLGYYRVRAAYASVADVSGRRADQHLDLLLALSAERARQHVSRTGHLPTVPRHALGVPGVRAVMSALPCSWQVVTRGQAHIVAIRLDYRAVYLPELPRPVTGWCRALRPATDWAALNQQIGGTEQNDLSPFRALLRRAPPAPSRALLGRRPGLGHGQRPSRRHRAPAER